MAIRGKFSAYHAYRIENFPSIGILREKNGKKGQIFGISHLNKKVVNTFFSNTDFGQSSSIKTMSSCSFILI